VGTREGNPGLPILSRLKEVRAIKLNLYLKAVIAFALTVVARLSIRVKR
jgi:hypothetical protein